MEVVLLDNASRDETWRIADSFGDERVRLFRNPQTLPLGENWNKAVSLSTGKLVKLVRPDDLLLPDGLAEQLKVMGDNGIAVASSKFRAIDATGAIGQHVLGLSDLLGPHDARTLLRVIVRRGPVQFGPISAAIFRRADFDRVGGFRGDLVPPMAVDLLARLCAFGSFYSMAEATVAWRDSARPESDVGNEATCGALLEMFRFHHRLGREYPETLGATDIVAGDLRLARAALERLHA